MRAARAGGWGGGRAAAAGGRGGQALQAPGKPANEAVAVLEHTQRAWSTAPSPNPHCSPPNRSGVCGNGICEIGERSVEGLLEGSCPGDCSVADSKARHLLLVVRGRAQLQRRIRWWARDPG